MNYARNYKNLLNFVKVMPKILVVPFFPDTVYMPSHRVKKLMGHGSTPSDPWPIWPIRFSLPMTHRPIPCSGVEISIRQLGRVEEIIWLPHDAGLSAAYESHGYSRRLPALFEFLHVDIQSTGHTLWRPWSRQLNDVMSEIECAQLHSELFSDVGTAHGSCTVSLR